MRVASPSIHTGPNGRSRCISIPALLEQGVVVVAGLANDVPDLEARALQLDLAPRDAGHVEEVVDEPRQVLRLPVDDLPRPLRLRRPGGCLVEEHDAVRIGASGLRSSCESTPRNSLLRWSASRNAASARLRSEMSLKRMATLRLSGSPTRKA